ncbi:unnamed protein product [Arctogadus glacialis]
MQAKKGDQEKSPSLHLLLFRPDWSRQKEVFAPCFSLGVFSPTWPGGNKRGCPPPLGTFLPAGVSASLFPPHLRDRVSGKLPDHGQRGGTCIRANPREGATGMRPQRQSDSVTNTCRLSVTGQAFSRRRHSHTGVGNGVWERIAGPGRTADAGVVNRFESPGSQQEKMGAEGTP